MIAGLGNPGREYANTPHNVGFEAVDSICRALGGDWRIEPRFKADVAKVSKDGEHLLLVRPMTYMNSSGEAVGAIMRYFRMEPADVVVVSDDVNLKPGRVRVRATGGAGGHNGLKSIIENLGTQDFTRVRIGVGRGENRGPDLIGHVLGRISEADSANVAEGIKTASEAALCAAMEGTVKAMDAYNAEEPETTEQSNKETKKPNPTTNESTENFNNKEKSNAQEI